MSEQRSADDDWLLRKETLIERILPGVQQIPGWPNVKESTLAVEDLSGLGGGSTFKLASGHRSPLVLHIDPKLMWNEEDRQLRFDRVREGQELLSNEGISAKRLYDQREQNWYIEGFVGINLSEAEVTVQLVEEIAELTARLHAIPPEWALKYRNRLAERYPAVSASEVKDHLWLHVIRFHQMLAHVNSEELTKLGQLGPRPASDAGARVVTAHGDILLQNVHRDSQGLLLIDLETIGANHAVADLAFTSTVVTRTKALRERFLNRYLEASGLSSSARDVFEVSLDIERCRMSYCWFVPESAWNLGGKPRAMTLKFLEDPYPELVELADEALINESLAEDIVENGFGGCQRVQEITASYVARRGN